MTPVKIFRLATLTLFAAAIAYFSWHFPQRVLLGQAFGEDLKMSLIIMGFTLGLLFFTKDRTPIPPPTEEKPTPPSAEE